MKTAGEKARDASCDYGIDDIQHRTMFASGYLQGYSEAIRWRDPKEECPGKSLPVVVKYEVSDGHVKYWVEEYSYERFVHDADDIGAKIIGWRPIE